MDVLPGFAPAHRRREVDIKLQHVARKHIRGRVDLLHGSGWRRRGLRLEDFRNMARRGRLEHRFVHEVRRTRKSRMKNERAILYCVTSKHRLLPLPAGVDAEESSPSALRLSRESPARNQKVS